MNNNLALISKMILAVWMPFDYNVLSLFSDKCFPLLMKYIIIFLYVDTYWDVTIIIPIKNFWKYTLNLYVYLPFSRIQVQKAKLSSIQNLKW